MNRSLEKVIRFVNIDFNTYFNIDAQVMWQTEE